MADPYIYNLTDTWNDVGTPFFAISMDVTDTASAAGSMLQRFRVNLVDVFGITKNGALKGFHAGIGYGPNGLVVESVLNAGAYRFSIGTAYASSMFFEFASSQSVTMGAEVRFGWGSRTSLSEPTGIELVESRDTALGRHSAGVVEVNDGTAGNLADLLARTFKNTPVAFGSLPSAATVGDGSRAFINDALTPTFGATAVGGGAVGSPVYAFGGVWFIG